MSGISETSKDVDMSTEVQNETLICFEDDVSMLSGFERNASHSAAIDWAVNLRAFKLVRLTVC